MGRRKLKKEKIIKILREHKEELKKYGVKRIALFGSYAEGKEREDSDIDLLIEFDKNFFGEDFDGLFDAYIKVESYLKKILKKKIDILTPVAIKTIRLKSVKQNIKKSLIYV